MKRIMIFSFLFVFFVLVITYGCSGFPVKITAVRNKKININSVNLSLKPISSMKLATIVGIRALFEEKLEEKNINIDINSPISMEVIFKKYEDGDIITRKITGFMLGFTLGKSARIEAQIILKNKKEEEIKNVNVAVRTSRNAWNLDAYTVVRNLEVKFVEASVKNIF